MSYFLSIAIFFIYSAAFNVFGTLISDVMASTSIPVATASLLAAMLQVGMFSAIVISPIMIKKLSPKSLIILGLLLSSFSLISLLFLNSIAAIFILFLIFGFASFFVDTSTNAYVSIAYKDKIDTYLPRLHFTFSLGALASGYIVLPFKGGNWKSAYSLFGFILLILAIIPLVSKRSVDRKDEVKQSTNNKILFKNKRFIFLSLSLMLYMASQNLCSLYMPLFIETKFGASNDIIAFTLLAFWIGIALMRYITPYLLRTKINAIKLMAAGLLITGACLTAALTIPFMVPCLIFIILTGFFAGATIPFYLVETSKQFSSHVAFISIFYMLVGTIGKIITVAIIGFLSQAMGVENALLFTIILPISSAIFAAISTSL